MNFRTRTLDGDTYTPLDQAGQRLRIPLASIRILRGHLGIRGFGRHAQLEIAGQPWDAWGTACGAMHCYCDETLKPPFGALPA